MKNMRKNYAQQNHMAYFTRSVPQGQVLPISLDGGQLELFPNAQPDNGLFEQWQPGEQGQVMPALFAVNPNTGHVIPIAFGMTSIDQMEIRIMSLVKA